MGAKPKQKQFYVLKFNSSRLKKVEYRIIIDFDQAKRNNEVIAIADNQILRSIKKIRGYEDIRQIYDYISVVINHDSHYDYLFEHGFYVNDEKYTRLLCSASHARNNTVIFCNDSIRNKLKKVLNNGRTEIPLVPSKFNAYYALSSSASKVVTTPKFCVVKDCLQIRDTLVNFVEECDKIDDEVVEKKVPIEYNYFDGMGLITPKMAKIWAKDLGEDDYIPAQFCIRQNFIKGMVAVFPFQEFATEIAHNYNITDIYGNDINIKDMDVILTESQFKLWDSFDNIKQYEDNCKANGLEWGVSKCTPKKDKETVFTNYQSLQTLKLSDKDILNLCKDTINWIKGAVYMNPIYSILFSMGENITAKSVEDNDNYWLKSLIANNSLLEDSYIREKIYNSIVHKIKNACLGRLLVKGNYSVLVSDPYAFCQHIFGMEVTGLLNENEYYSNFWNDKKVKTVNSMRSPLTYYSEHNLLKLKKNENLEKWYRYLYSGIIVNVHGDDVLRWADSDYDFDIIMTTNSKEMIKGVLKDELPITYAKRVISKKDIEEVDLFEADKMAFGSAIGSITNKSTTIYTMLPSYKKDSLEYKELIKRLRICRKAQGSEIDKAKGLDVKEFPKHWCRYQKIEDEDSEEIKSAKIFYNSILVEKKPYFFIYLYNDLKKKYKRHKQNYNEFCLDKFGVSLFELIDRKKNSDEEKKVIKRYERYSPTINSNCEMNRICKYMEGIHFNLRNVVKKDNNKDIHLIYKRDDLNFKDSVYKKISKIISNNHKEARDYKKIGNKFNKTKYDKGDRTLENMREQLKKDLYAVCSDDYELTNYLIRIYYDDYPNQNKDFLWKYFGEYIYMNVKMKTNFSAKIPVRDDILGDVEYLGKKYKLEDIRL